MAYTRGAHEVGDGLWAYLQPDGGWGWSNAGLVTPPVSIRLGPKPAMVSAKIVVVLGGVLRG